MSWWDECDPKHIQIQCTSISICMEVNWIDADALEEWNNDTSCLLDWRHWRFTEARSNMFVFYTPYCGFHGFLNWFWSTILAVCLLYWYGYCEEFSYVFWVLILRTTCGLKEAMKWESHNLIWEHISWKPTKLQGFPGWMSVRCDWSMALAATQSFKKCIIFFVLFFWEIGSMV